MREGDTTEFSRLKTVSKFDEGGSSTVAMDMSRTQGLAMFSPPSLFVESLLEQLCKLFEKDPIRQRELYLTICQQLHKMNLIDESYKIDELQYMRSHYQKALYHYLSVAKSTLVENKAIFPASSKLSLRSEDVLEWSRYSTEFRELKFIAKGGFGHVYKSQNLLDGGTYAIKKLFLSYRSISGFLQKLREVKMLAKLNHPNIVAYKAAWLEPLETKSARSKKNVPAISEPKMKTSNGDSLEVVFEHSSREESVESQQESHDDKSSSFMTSFSESRSSLSTPFSSDSTCTSNNKIICKYKCKERREQQYRFTYTSMAGQQSNCAILFIQMQLCQTTLRQWLDARNQLPPNKEEISPVLFNVQESLDIFKHIVRGIEYIHSQGIVHHDIKPSNIFVSEDLKHVQVGDFGLSCCLLAHSSSSGSTSPLMSENGYAQHQLGQYGGTKLYAAPEQMKNLCHPKSDIYSLGIVLLELIKPFQTAMERSKVLSQLKSGQVPLDVGSSWPHLALIIRRMVSGRLEKRPTASELLAELEESEKVNAAQLIEHQKDIIKILTQENVDIRRQNVEKDEEIASLRRRLEDIMSRFDLNVETK